MTPRIFNSDNTKTEFIQLDTAKCEACWKCIDTCPGGVMGKIDLPWHKHVLMANPLNCSGCLTCISECDAGAFTESSVQMHKNKTDTQKLSFGVNISLMTVAAAMIFSGFLIQFAYHMGNHGEIATEMEVYSLDYYAWSAFHKISIAIITLLVTIHTILHWKWYRTVVTKNLISKNKQALLLTVIFFLVAFTGYSSWIIHITNGSEMIRKFFIELHDKLALFLFIFLILHVAGRLRWFIKASGRKSEEN